MKTYLQVIAEVLVELYARESKNDVNQNLRSSLLASWRTMIYSEAGEDTVHNPVPKPQ